MRFILILCFLTALGCAKNVLDEAPVFRLTMPEWDGSLDRDNLNDGPSFQIRPEKIGDVKEASKKLLCDGIEISGKIIATPDVSLFQFKLSETDFPGLSTLPTSIRCKLRVGLRNFKGSLFEKDFPLTLNFNKQPKINITKMSALGGGAVPQTKPQLILLERYVIQNNFNYTLGFVYFGQEFSCSISPPASSTLMIVASKTTTTRMVLSGNYLNAEGDYFSRLNFQVPPGETVQLEVYGSISSDLQIGSVKTHFSDCIPTQSLATWYSKDEKANPIRLAFPETKPLPEWQRGNP